MEDLVESLTRGNVAEVKVLLASVALALGVYQLAVIVVGYGKVRVPFLAAPPAFAAHRAVGDTIALLLLCTGVMCVSVYGFEDDRGRPRRRRVRAARRPRLQGQEQRLEAEEERREDQGDR
jgi:hypothetical protein